MEEWKEYKLGDIADITKLAGFEFTKYVKYIKDGEIIAVRALNLRDGHLDLQDVQRISRDVSNGLLRSKLYKGDIVLSYTGTIGACAIITENDKYHLAPNVCKITPTVSIDPFFLYYIIRSKAFQNSLIGYAHGSTQPTIPMKTIREIPIRICNKNVQHKIASILFALDDKIECNKRINDNLEQQAQALFKSWFVDFEPFKDQPFVDSELGMIPKGWKILSLNDACLKVTDGSHYSPKDDPLGNIPMLSVKDMQHNGFDYSSCKKINEEEYNKMKANDCVPLKNDILVAKDGSYLKEIFLCMQEVKQAILSSIALFRCNLDVIYPEILLQLLRLPTIRKDVGDNYVSGSALPRIVLKDFKKFRFVVAPINIQNKIINTLHSLCLQIYNNDQESRRLAELRDTLLPRLMSGEINIKEISL